MIVRWLTNLSAVLLPSFVHHQGKAALFKEHERLKIIIFITSVFIPLKYCEEVFSRIISVSATSYSWKLSSAWNTSLLYVSSLQFFDICIPSDASYKDSLINPLLFTLMVGLKRLKYSLATRLHRWLWFLDMRKFKKKKQTWKEYIVTNDYYILFSM